MRAGPAAALLAATLVAATGCRPRTHVLSAQEQTVELAKREAHLKRALAHPDSGTRDTAIARWVVTGDLTEISGLALTGDGRLFTHGDEHAQVSELDFRRGVLLKRFTLGTPPVKGDFESIAAVGDTLFMLTSKGKLYQFRDGANGADVPYTIHDTGLRHECEFEGLAFDPAIHSLLFACKNVLTEGHLQDSMVVYRWAFPLDSATPPTRITTPLTRVIGSNGWTGLHPSDITIEPFNGNYVLVAGEEHALIEITPTGALVFSRPLPDGLAHAEGVAITRDSILIISTEATRKMAAAVTLYRWL